MTAAELYPKSQEEIQDFIRTRRKELNLTSFEMSGYESKPGECTLHNMAILNAFADLGIYDYTAFLFLDFYKGQPMLYLQYWNEDKAQSFDFSGASTSKIIYNIFLLTIFSGKRTRRRS